MYSLKMMQHVYGLLFMLNIYFCEILGADIFIALPNGIIRGKQSVTNANTTFYSFLKVPYASPPVGELRFKAPIPAKKWDGILDTTSNLVICYQVNRESDLESEDGLYLNIYTPKLPAIAQDVKLPVIFYIHGGGFIQGTCLDFICGPDFFIDSNIVVVTINYRLGPFGFLSTEDEVIPGNNGLKDQHLGIKWTHENIKYFGGDPHRIIIVGQSAGAASVAYQLLNHKSKGLFSGAICESGSFLSPWSFQRRAREIAFKTAGYINETFNNKNDSTELLNFLMSLDADDIDDASYQINLSENLKTRQINQGYFYAPVIEPDLPDAFITRKMYGDLKSGNFVKVPLIIGVTSEESLEDAADLNLLQFNMRQYDENLDWLVPDDLNLRNETKEIVGSLIRSFYTVSSKFEENLSSGIRYFSDTSFTRSVIRHAELQSKFTDVYFYQFSYDGIIGNVSITLPGTNKVAHTEDLRYMWKIDFQGYNNTNIDQFPASDIIAHKRMVALWTNFAKTLNPTPFREELLQDVLWPTVSFGKPKDFLYLDIDENLSVKNFPKAESYIFWKFIYEIFGQNNFDTY